MRLNQFVFLLASTVGVGAVAGIVTSLLGLWMQLPWYVGLVSGAFFSTTSLMGFWAYLTLNFIARVTLPRRVWRWAQAVFLAVVLYDMLWWRYRLQAHGSWSAYLIQGLWPLGVALIGAWFKQRISGKSAFLPALFFLYVFTVVDSLPFIWLQYGWSQTGQLVNQILVIVMVCNLYITLLYGKLLAPQSSLASQMNTADQPSM